MFFAVRATEKLVGSKFYPVRVKKVCKKAAFDGSKKKRESYLRFRNIIMFCGVVQMYVHPLSISCPASFSSLAIAWW
jgi:hypothetical protein